MLLKIFTFLSYLQHPTLDVETRKKVVRHGIISLLLVMMIGFLWTGYTIFTTQAGLLGFLLIITVFITLGHGIYASATGQTYWSSRIRSMKNARKAAQDSKADLLAYAEKMKKRTHDQYN